MLHVSGQPDTQVPFTVRNYISLYFMFPYIYIGTNAHNSPLAKIRERDMAQMVGQSLTMQGVAISITGG